MVAGDCLRCHLPPVSCECIDYLADSGFPAAHLEPDIFIYVHASYNRKPKLPPPVLRVRVQVGDQTRSEDLRSAEPKILAWRDALIRHRGQAIDLSLSIENDLFRLHKEYRSYKRLAAFCNEKIEHHLLDFVSDEKIVEEVKASHPDNTSAQLQSLTSWNSQHNLYLNSSDGFNWGVGLREARDLLSAIAWTSPAIANGKKLTPEERSEMIEAELQHGLEIIRNGGQWTSGESPIDRIHITNCIRRVRYRNDRPSSRV